MKDLWQYKPKKIWAGPWKITKNGRRLAITFRKNHPGTPIRSRKEAEALAALLGAKAVEDRK